MPSTRIAAKGASIKHGSSASPSTVLNGLRSVALTVGARAMINATCHDSTTTFDQIAAPLRDTNELEFTLAWDPNDTGHEALRAAHAAGTLYYLTLLLPNATPSTYALAGYFTSHTAPAMNPETGLLECSFKFKAKGADTFTQ